ncbi:LuxR family transcriptional regulator [Salinibacterium sp. G-O1]|uniref:helix-turn-helix transcriptional regulator n=1 Tax=Salinibacterium sp. G-O1 TaxID=3046208 RepID=UPI0032D92133
MKVIGRRAELDQIAHMSSSPHESALLVLGDVGVGKTRLLEAAEEESGIEAVLLRINPADAGWPLSGFFTVLAAINSSKVLDIGTNVTLSTMEPGQLFAAAREILSLIRALALPPMLLLVDDIDAMDEASQMLVGFMVGRLGGTGIRFVATSTGADTGGQFGGLPRLRLDPLNRQMALDLALAARPDCRPTGTLGIVVAQTERNPRAILESLKGLSIEQLEGLHPLTLPLTPGATARAYARAVLPTLTPAQLLLLERLSAAPMLDVSTATRGGVSDEDALQDLIFLGIVEVRGREVKVKRPLLRSHVYWSMTSRARRELHLAEAEGASSRCALWHQSFGPADPEMVDRLLSAAVSFVREGSTRVAIEFADRALTLNGNGRTELTGISELARVLFERGELALATRYATGGLNITSSDSVHLKLTLLRLLIDFMDDQHLPDNDLDAWEAMYSAKFPAETATVLAVAALCRALRWELPTARKLLTRADGMESPPSGRARSVCDLANELVAATDGLGSDDEKPKTRHAADRLASLPTIDLLIDARAHTMREEHFEASRLCAIVLNRRPQPVWADAARYLLADADIRSGEFAAACTTIVEWKAQCIPGARAAFHSYLDSWLAYAEDRLPEALSIIAAELDGNRRDRSPALAASLLTLRGEIGLIDGDVEGSRRALMMAHIIDGQFEHPALVRHAPDLVEVHLLAGRRREARAVHDNFARKAHNHPSRWARVALSHTTALITDDNNSALLLFDDALNSLRPGDSLIQIARIHTAKASRLLAMGRAIDASEPLSAALDAFETAGARAWVRKVTAMITALTPDTVAAEAWPMLAGLHVDERAVVELVLKGYRNKEIAAELFISLRTVEARLTHIYRSVGASSRSHLVSMMS